MGKPYSNDLRDRVVATMACGRNCRDVACGRSCRDVAAIFNVAPSTAGNWYRRYQRTSNYSARPMGGDHRSKLLSEAAWIAERLATVPNMTLGDIRMELAERDIKVSYASVWRTVTRLGLRLKKCASTPVSRTGSTSRSRARSGVSHNVGSISHRWCLSMRRGPRQA